MQCKYIILHRYIFRTLYIHKVLLHENNGRSHLRRENSCVVGQETMSHVAQFKIEEMPTTYLQQGHKGEAETGFIFKDGSCGGTLKDAATHKFPTQPLIYCPPCSGQHVLHGGELRAQTRVPGVCECGQGGAPGHDVVRPVCGQVQVH